MTTPRHPQIRQPNPVLEELRDNIPAPPDIEEIIRELITTPKIHAAHLYFREGRALLQALCLCLSGTKPSHHYPGWEDFGIKLGLDPILIKNIKYSFHLEDPASYVFLAYVQKEDATIEQIIHTLYEIGRHDIVLEVKVPLKTFSNNIIAKCITHEDTNIIKPAMSPNCPFIFKNLEKLREKYAESKLVSEKLLRSTPVVYQRKANQYTKTILLTYAYDASEILEKCLMHLRRPRGNSKLGVVLLNEQLHQLNISAEQFIFECFAQVDYVFPIITFEYIKRIMGSTKTVTSSVLNNADDKYVKYIYRLMNTHYLNNGCKNTMVRSIIPDNMANEVLQRSIMNHSLFQIWVRSNEIDMLVDAILKSVK